MTDDPLPFARLEGFTRLGPTVSDPVHCWVLVGDRRLPESAELLYPLPELINDYEAAAELLVRAVGPLPYFVALLTDEDVTGPAPMRCHHFEEADSERLVEFCENLHDHEMRTRSGVTFFTCLQPWTLDLIRVAFLRVAGFA